MGFSKHETMGKARATEEKGGDRELGSRESAGWREGGVGNIMTGLGAAPVPAGLH